MWSKGIINVTRLKCIFLILGLGLTQALCQNVEPVQSDRRNELGKEFMQGYRYNETGLTAKPISPGSITTQTTKQPFNWEAFPEDGKGAMLNERKDLLARNLELEPAEVMPQAMSNKDNKETFSTLASSTPSEKNSDQNIGATTLGTVVQRMKKRGERRHRVKQFLVSSMSYERKSNLTEAASEFKDLSSSESGIRGDVDVQLNDVNRSKKDRSKKQRGRGISSSRKKKPKKSNLTRKYSKEVKESRERRKRMRLERRRRRNREKKRRNKAQHDKSWKNVNQKQPRDQPAAMFLSMSEVNHKINGTKEIEESGSNVKSSNGFVAGKVELLKKHISVNQQRDQPDAAYEDHENKNNGQNISGDREDIRTLYNHKDNVEKEFSRQFEIELSKSQKLESDREDVKHWSKFISPLGSVNSKFNENTSENPRFNGNKMLGYSVSESELTSDNVNKDVLSRNMKYYHEYVTNGLRLSKFPTSQLLHSMYNLPEVRRNSFSENSNISSPMVADHPPLLLGDEQQPFENSSKKDSISNIEHMNVKLNDSLAKNLHTYFQQISKNIPSEMKTVDNDDNSKGDLSCMDGTFIPAPLVRHALIKYVKSSTPGHEYLEADYECTPGYYMLNQARRLLCNNRHWVGDMPKCKLRQNPNDVCANSPCEQVCREVNGNPMCACYKGFRQEGVKCIDINECEKGNGGCDFTCLNTPGSYRCECPKGMRQGENKYSCMDINECLLNNGHGPCQDTCQNLEGGYRCSCEGLPGTILGLNNHTCQDSGPCGINNAGCSHTCLSTMGRVFCLCPDGFMLEDDWKTCQDVDECAVPDLQSIVCQHGCINTPGSYRCAEPPEMQDEPPSNLVSKSCDPGFELSINGVCVDIDECSISNGGCLEVCENTAGSYFCACNGDEHLLAADGRTCVDINDIACPALNPSGRGYVMCSRLTTPKPWRGRKRVINRPGTKCFLRCPYGYQLRGEYELTCGTNGDWIGSKHGECVRYSKPRLDCPPNLIAEVPPGQSEAFVTFAQPSTDLDWFRYVRSEPSWGTRLEANLVPGEHKVTFIAKHPVSKKQTTCTLRITVKPGEAPRIKNCPENILAYGKNRTIVNWTEPIFTDNVKITNVISNKNSGHLLSIGEHKIHYEARDEAGWTATCEFLVIVKEN